MFYIQCTLYVHGNVHIGFFQKIYLMFQKIFKLCRASYSSETYPRLYGARSATASLAAATCNDATVYHLSEVLSTAM